MYMTSLSATPSFVVNLDGEFNIRGQINVMSTDIEHEAGSNRYTAFRHVPNRLGSFIAPYTVGISLDSPL